MNTTTQTTTRRTATFEVAGTLKSLPMIVLNWLVAKDQAYRDAIHVKSLSDEALRDVGMKR